MKPIICHCPNCRRYHHTRRALVSAKRKAARMVVRCTLRREPEKWESLPTVFVVGYSDWPLYARHI
jgi:hypothetical protein